MLNPAPAPRQPVGFLHLADVLTPNEPEAERLCGVSCEDPEPAARALRAQGAGAVVLTLGARGCFVLSGEGAARLPAQPVEAVDATAAGDVFSGALTVALTSGRRLAEAAEFANRAAGLSVTRRGAVPSIPWQSEL